jgi:HEAT repeat protein
LGALARLNNPDLPRLPNDAEIAKALDELRSNHPFRSRDAAEQLAKQPPVEKHRKDVSDALMKLTSDRSVFTRQAAYRALVVWAKPDDVPELVAALEREQHPGSRTAIIDALAALKDARAAEPLAKRLGDRLDRDHAAKGLIALGPAAEEAVRPQLKHRDLQARIKACEVLSAIGTAASVEDLEAAATDANPAVAQAATKALDAVKARP